MPMTSPMSTRPYHHGGLRDALVVAAERLMAEQASSTFTLREVARAAGVSHNAPYNHFADRRALLAAVAARGFDGLAVALRGALQRVPADGAAAGLRATVDAYIAFAVAHPSRYRLMFSAELAGCEDPALQAAEERAFAALRDLVARGVAQGQLAADPHASHALAAWPLGHGLSTLMLDGRVPAGADARAVSALTSIVATTLVDGLARREPEPSPSAGPQRPRA